MAAILFSLGSLFVRIGFILNATDHLVVYFSTTIVIMSIIIRVNKLNSFESTNNFRLLSIRSFLGVVGLMLFYFGLLFIPISDAASISQTSVIITALLSRIFLKEKMGIPHLFALAFTIMGVMFISKPSILFSKIETTDKEFQIANTNMTVNTNISSGEFIVMQEQTYNSNKLDSDKTFQFLVGIVSVVLAAFLFGTCSIVVKKLCNKNVHWSIITIYPACFGLPLCAVISFILYFKEFSHKNIKSELPELPYHILYSSISAVFGILGQVFFNISLTCEDATKVSIAKTSDVIFSYILQLIILDIKVDIFSIFGSISILLGTFIVLSFKIIEDTLEKSSKNKSCFKKTILLKF